MNVYGVKADMVPVDGRYNSVIPLLSRAISERFRDKVHDEELYKSTLISF